MKTRARIASVQVETPTVKSFRLDLEDAGFSFFAGQWVDLRVELQGVVRVAGYSITSSPLTRGSIELAVKAAGSNPVTRYLLTEAKIGDFVELDGGHGDVYFTDGMANKLTLIGGGIGVTPLMSILRYVDDAALEVDVTLIASARSPSELVFRRQIEAIAKRNPRVHCFSTVTGDAGEAWDGRVGRIDDGLLREVGADPQALYYVCGPGPMIDGIAAAVQGLGVPARNVRFERWW